MGQVKVYAIRITATVNETSVTIAMDKAALVLVAKTLSLKLIQILPMDAATLLLNGKTATITTFEYIALQKAGIALSCETPKIVGGTVDVCVERLVDVAEEDRVVIVPAEDRIVNPKRGR